MLNGRVLAPALDDVTAGIERTRHATRERLKCGLGYVGWFRICPNSYLECLEAVDTNSVVKCSNERFEMRNF